jgi:magnesium transporter
MANFEKTYHPPGTAPGTLVSHEGADQSAVKIRLIDYSDSDFIEKELASSDECQPYLDRESITWIHMQGPLQAGTIKNIGNIFELHPLTLEDVLNTGQRPKVEEYDDLLFVILSMPTVTNGITTIEQVSLFMGEDYIISFHAGDYDPFEPLRNRLRKKSGRIRSLKADYLLYGIIDLVIDQGYPVLEGIGENIENIEESILKSSAEQATLGDIHHIRRKLLLLRRNLWPQRDAVNSLLRSENLLIKKGTLIYIRDCYDHTIQILDLIENYREMAASLIDIYISSTSYRLNEIMRVLTIISTIFIPLSFIVGLYGMNFSHPGSPWAMPELHWYYGYPMVWGVMLATVVGMVIYFKRKDWF